MGNETEFGILNGGSAEKSSAIQGEILSLPHLASAKARGGVFLSNGARAYVDQGQNEYATPETNNPIDLVVREMAGRALMQQMADLTGLSLLCSNYDYATHNNWGSHENYECSRRFPNEAALDFATHLVTRMIFTGAGGIEPRHPGVRVILSPRATVMKCTFNWQGHIRKSLVFLKPEDHCSGHRLHILGGEALLSHTASFLRYGTTALVALLVDRGHRIGPGSFQISPIQMLHRINRDVSLSRRFKLTNGAKLTAIEIQWSILEDVAGHLKALPDWAPSVIERWERVLNRLATGDARASETIDWMIYRDALIELADEYGTTLNAFGALPANDKHIRQFRAAACELYVRLHALGRESLFHRLELSGLTQHRLPEISDERIAAAMDEPPAGRASNRGTFVRKHNGRSDLQVTWDHVVDLVTAENIAIPHDSVPGWDRVERSPLRKGTSKEPRNISALFRLGRYSDVIDGLVGPSRNSDEFEITCFSYARLGMRAETEEVLAWAGSQFDRSYVIAMSMSARNQRGLTPPLDEIERLIILGDKLMPGLLHNRDGCDSYIRFTFLQFKALCVMHRGRYDEAKAILCNLLDDHENRERPRMYARTRCHLAELLRRQGLNHQALDMANIALSEHYRNNVPGDRADFSLPVLAKLVPDSEADELISLAEATQRDHRNPLGLARVLCLRARRLCTNQNREEILHLLETVPALKDCRTAARIAANWDQWSAPGSIISTTDYWGL